MQATGYALPPNMVADLAHRTVAIEPYENSVAFAYPSIHWDPEPVLQTYAAYASNLDTLDSTFITSAKAPSRILEETPLVTEDGRDPYFESPTTYVTTVCRTCSSTRPKHGRSWSESLAGAMRAGPSAPSGQPSASRSWCPLALREPSSWLASICHRPGGSKDALKTTSPHFFSSRQA